MKREALLRYLREQGWPVDTRGRATFLVGQSRQQSSILGAATQRSEVVDLLAVKICKDLGVPPIK